ncbi:MAG: hypothetical protein Q9228_004245 [Teloschistes exilis]
MSPNGTGCKPINNSLVPTAWVNQSEEEEPPLRLEIQVNDDKYPLKTCTVKLLDGQHQPIKTQTDFLNLNCPVLY